jgi:hypothetical protein
MFDLYHYIMSVHHFIRYSLSLTDGVLTVCAPDDWWYLTRNM